MRFVYLKEVSFDLAHLVAFSATSIPETMRTPEYPTLTLWLHGFTQPVVAVYETEEERMEAINFIKESLESIE
jgi:hypothetical protein